MTSKNDHHDAQRQQYISHKLYLERRHGNRYYNLGYMTYKSIIDDTTNANATATNLQEALMNFDIALLFNPNDVDAKARQDYLCKIWGPNAPAQNSLGFPGATVFQPDINRVKNEARKIHRNCTC